MEESTREFFSWLVAIFATYRVAYLMTIDTGPGRIFEKARDWITKKFGAESWQAEGASCFFCQSVWYAAPAALMIQPRDLGDFILLWLSIAGAATVLHWWVLERMRRVNDP